MGTPFAEIACAAAMVARRLLQEYGAPSRRFIYRKGRQGGPRIRMTTRRRLTDAGVLVRHLRSLRGWKQGELARAAGTSQKLISSYELGEKIPRRRTLERLAAAVGVPFSLAER